MTLSELRTMIPWQPHAGWLTPYWTEEKLKAIIIFRWKRMEDPEFEALYEVIQQEAQARKEWKKARRKGNW